MSSPPSHEEQRPTARHRGMKEQRAPAGRVAQPRHRNDSHPHGEEEDKVSSHIPLPPRRKGTSRPSGRDDSPSDIATPRRKATSMLDGRDDSPAGIQTPPRHKEEYSEPRREDNLTADPRAMPGRKQNSRPNDTDNLASDIPTPRGRRNNESRHGGDVPEVSTSRTSNPSNSRLGAALKPRNRTAGLHAQPSGSQPQKCEGRDCEFRKELSRERAMRIRKETEVETTKQQLHEARVQITELKAVAESKQRRERLEAKQQAQQTKLSAEEQKRREKLDATEKKRQQKREHELELEKLKTPEERLAEKEVKLAKYKLAQDVANSAGNLAVDAHRTQAETRREGARDNGSRNAARRPTTAKGPAPRPTPASEY